MRYDKGYIDLDGFVPFLVIVGIIIGLLSAYGIPYLWSCVKPFIHYITA